MISFDMRWLAAMIGTAASVIVMACGGTGGGTRGAGAAAGIGGAGGSSGLGGTSGAGGSGASGGSAGFSGSSNAYCPGETPWPAGATLCRANSDCSVGEVCYKDGPPDYSGVCGACLGPDQPCATDAECVDAVCKPFDDPCNCAIGARECGPRCTADSCAEGERCRADGHCEVIPCNDGWTCTSEQTCSPGDTGADVHGCAWISCTDGWQCTEGTVCEPNQGYIHDLHGCRTIPCDQAGARPCGPNSDCLAGAPEPLCRIRECSRDTECDCGACVFGACAVRPGICAVEVFPPG